MAQYLTVEDLSRFLRSRKSDLCRIAADFVTERPDDPATIKALDAVERWADKLAAAAPFFVSGVQTQYGLGLNQRCRWLGVLGAFSLRDVACLGHKKWWVEAVACGLFWIVRGGFGNGWASVLVRILKPGNG